MYFDRIGTLNIKKIHEVSSTDRLLEYFTWYSEATVHYRLAAASVAAGKHIGKSVYVMDMRGFGISKFGSDMRAFLKTFTKIASENYPEVRPKPCTCCTCRTPTPASPPHPCIHLLHTPSCTRSCTPVDPACR